MIKTVHEGLNASTLKFVTFRVSTKLTKDFTMFVNVPRSLKIKFEGLMSKINSQNPVTKDQGPKHKHLKGFCGSEGPGGPPGGPYAGRVTCPATENSQMSVMGLISSCNQLYPTLEPHQWDYMQLGALVYILQPP